MTDALRRLAEGGRKLGLPATFEATHHGPELSLPAFFVEIGYGTEPEPSSDAVRLLSEMIPTIEPDPSDRVALAVGGGHYAPHFTDLAIRRRWAFGHIVSRHSLAELDRPTATQALQGTPEAEGILYARAADADHPAVRDFGPPVPRGIGTGEAGRGGKRYSATLVRLLEHDGARPVDRLPEPDGLGRGDPGTALGEHQALDDLAEQGALVDLGVPLEELFLFGGDRDVLPEHPLGGYVEAGPVRHRDGNARGVYVRMRACAEGRVPVPTPRQESESGARDRWPDGGPEPGEVL